MANPINAQAFHMSRYALYVALARRGVPTSGAQSTAELRELLALCLEIQS